ncbi:mitochondrial dynamics protein MID49 isoform X1 [Petromyzon marinus]|uniref:mitochondrial dynamics protein MID49 isoform X1 n=2 Tax=Petromyzon marinus TaxID=7757 RepID=UPI003F6F3860
MCTSGMCYVGSAMAGFGDGSLGPTGAGRGAPGNRGDRGIGHAIDFVLSNARLVLGVGGAAMLGIATLAVKRAYDRAVSAPVSPTRKPEDVGIAGLSSWEEPSWVGASPRLLSHDMRSTVSRSLQSLPQGLAGDAAVLDDEQLKSSSANSLALGAGLHVGRAVPAPDPRRAPLQRHLLSFYRRRVLVAPSQVAAAKHVALEICSELREFLRARHSELPLDDMSLCGGLCEDLAVVAPDRVALALPLLLEERLWTAVPGEETIMAAPGCWLLRRDNAEYFPRGLSVWDRWLVGAYLSPVAIAEALRRIVADSVNWPAIGAALGYRVRPCAPADGLALEVTYREGEDDGEGDGAPDGVGERRLRVDVLLRVTLASCTLVARPGDAGGAGGRHAETLWRQSFRAVETERLRELDARDSGSRLLCLKLLKAVCRTHPGLERLRSEHLRSLILHACDAGAVDWAEDALAERFLELLRELVERLERGSLPAAFCPALNLLAPLSEDEVDELGYTLYSAISQPEKLLQG